MQFRFARPATALGICAACTLAACNGDGDGDASAARDAQEDAAQCAALAGRSVPEASATLTTATWNAGPTTIGSTTVAPAFCRVIGVSRPTADSQIGFEVWLPPHAAWNGKFQGIGSGSSAGSIATAAMVLPLTRGYAAMSTDNGHITDTSRPNGAAEQTWALGHPQKVIDFAYRALHVSTVAGKAATADFYARAPEKSYFVGCSQGGHHALMEASRFPADYDGIVAGAPAWEWANLMAAELWNSSPALADPTAVTAAKVRVLNTAVIGACDAIDGVTDGVIDDPRKCTFDPAAIQCPAGTDGPDCLTPVQVAAAKKIYGGARKSNGVQIFPPYTRGSELGWTPLYTGAMPGGSGWDFFRYSVFQNPSFDNRTFDFDADYDRAMHTLIAGETVPAVYNATADLAAFRARGGKLIIYHGWADHQITPLSSIDYHDRVVAAQGGKAATDSFMRLFMAPGVGHCAGGPGPQNFGGSSGAAPVVDAEHDVTIALDRWVTQGVAPDRLIATRVSSGAVTRSRPLCVHPKVAKYRGSGSTDEAANFTCVDPT